jgi:hypothetical protein
MNTTTELQGTETASETFLLRNTIVNSISDGNTELTPEIINPEDNSYELKRLKIIKMIRKIRSLSIFSKDEIIVCFLSYLATKDALQFRTLNRKFNQFVLSGLSTKLIKEYITLDTEFAKKYSEYVLTKNVSHYEFFNNINLKKTNLFFPENEWVNLMINEKFSKQFYEKYNLYKYIGKVFKTKPYIEHEVYNASERTDSDFETLVLRQDGRDGRVSIWNYKCSLKMLKNNLYRIREINDLILILRNSKLSEAFIEEFLIELKLIRMNRRNLTNILMHHKKSQPVKEVSNNISIKNIWKNIWKYRKIFKSFKEKYDSEFIEFDDFIKRVRHDETFLKDIWTNIWKYQKTSEQFRNRYRAEFQRFIEDARQNKSILKDIWTNGCYTISEYNSLFL